tara:strand:- start:130 stop:411 length:282 start_codon:yes stop_codon:yes gene_type:complete
MTEREKQLRRDVEMSMSTAMWLDEEIANTVDLMLDLEKTSLDGRQLQTQQDRLEDLLVRVTLEKDNIYRLSDELEIFIKKSAHKKQYSVSFKK